MKHANMQEKTLEHSEWLVSKETETGIKRSQEALVRPPGFDGKHCIEEECSEPIPPERLALGAFRCIECQTKHEDKERMNKWLKP